VNIRAQIESDLSFSLESQDDWGMPVEIIDPATGLIQTQSANDATKLLAGQVLYDRREQDPDTGLEIWVHRPVVTLRVSSLDAIPVRGWIVRFALSPVEGAPLVSHYIERVPQDGRSIGFIRLYPGKLVQE
jgi:hypothetical protein